MRYDCRVHNRFVLLLACTVLAASLVAQAAVAQNFPALCTVQGAVADDWGTPLPNITVTLGDAVQAASTGQGGAFAFFRVTPGRYRVYTRANGYSTAVSDEFMCGPGQVRQIYLVIVRLMRSPQ